MMKKASFLVLLFLGFNPCWALAQKCEVDSGFRGSYFLVGYDQRKLVKLFRSLDDIPEGVRTRLNNYLQTKLGPEFAGKLKFEEGQWLDLRKLQKQFPSRYEDNAGRGSYYLLFSFSDHAKGLKVFFSRMVLNEDGSVYREIGMPDIGSQPDKAKIISCREAYSIAESEGFPPNLCFASFEYSDTLKAFVWVIHDTREVEPDDPRMPRFKGTFRNIEINANTGTVVRIYKHTIII